MLYWKVSNAIYLSSFPLFVLLFPQFSCTLGNAWNRGGWIGRILFSHVPLKKKSAEIFYIKLDCRKRSPSMSSNIMRRKYSFCIPFTTEAATATTFCLDNQMYIDSIPYMKLCKRCGKGVIRNITIILSKRWKNSFHAKIIHRKVVFWT